MSGNQDNAFDSLAAERLGVSETDLHCLNIIENSGGLSAGELAAAVRTHRRRHHRGDRPTRERAASRAAFPIRPIAGA